MNQPLSKIQEQFWVLGNLYSKTPTYNIPLVYKLSGTLCVQSFKEALIKVLSNHSMLSASIQVKGNSPYFKIPSTLNIDDYFKTQHLQIQSSDDAFDNYVLTQVNKPFKLDGDFLTRIRYISFSDSAYIVFVFHHIIIDHHSKRIFLSDLSKFYSSLN